jgi:hypothetical protein
VSSLVLPYGVSTNDRAADTVEHSPPPGAIFQEGEELLYEVSWTMFKLGTIRLIVKPNHAAEAHIHSYDGLPFVDLHSIHYTAMDSLFNARATSSIEKRQEDWWGLRYTYDFLNRRVRVDETLQKDLQSPPRITKTRDSLRLQSSQVVDGLSIAYFPRMFVHTAQTVNVPTILYGKLGTTTFHFTNKKVKEQLDAVEEPVRAVEIEGTTDVEGVFGMTGDFRGWFSDDSAAVPLKGKLKVLLGNVNVELIQWKRRDWNPPH